MIRSGDLIAKIKSQILKEKDYHEKGYHSNDILEVTEESDSPTPVSKPQIIDPIELEGGSSSHSSFNSSRLVMQLEIP
jgi:hypothetical protein